MLNKMSFYIYLSSNTVNKNTNDTNTCSNFTTHLPSTLRLEGKWSVGLSNISYTKSWATTNGTKIYWTHAQPTSRMERNHLIEMPSIHGLPKGHYDIEQKCTLINKLLTASAVKKLSKLGPSSICRIQQNT